MVIGFALGVVYMGWHTGAWTTTGAAADQQQTAVVEAVADAKQIGAQDDRAGAAAQRVVTRTVTVAADCPPGVGPVSADVAAELRISFAKAGPGASSRKAGTGSAPE